MKAAQRFVLRVTGLLSERKQTQKSLIRGDKTEGWMSNIVNLRRSLRLDDAEEIAEALDVPLSELVRRPDDVTYELSGNEARLLDAYRQLASVEQQALITLATLRSRRVGRPTKKQGVSPTKALIPHHQPGLNRGLPPISAAAATPGASREFGSLSASVLPPAVQEIIAKYEHEIANYFALRDSIRGGDTRISGQVGSSSRPIARTSPHRGELRGPGSKPDK